MASAFKDIQGRRSDIAVSLEDLAFLPLRQCVQIFPLLFIQLLALALTHASQPQRISAACVQESPSHMSEWV